MATQARHWGMRHEACVEQWWELFYVPGTALSAYTY